MIIKNDNGYGSADGDTQFFKENYSKINPIKKITAYFDYQNFLLTDYDVESGTTFVAESWNGNQIHLTGLNCGYGGTSPSATAHILTKLGMDFDVAHKIKAYPELKVYFDKDGKYQNYEVNKNVFFSSQAEYSNLCSVYLENFTYFEKGTRKLYLINPQYHSPQALYNAIDKASLYQLQYYIGNKSPLDNGYTPSNIHLPTSVNFKERIDGVNIVMYGRKFDVLILADERVSLTLLNNVYSYLFKAPLFKDSLLSMQPQHGIKSYISKLLFKQPEKISGSKNIIEV